jgi:hypothetical protein
MTATPSGPQASSFACKHEDTNKRGARSAGQVRAEWPRRQGPGKRKSGAAEHCICAYEDMKHDKKAPHPPGSWRLLRKLGCYTQMPRLQILRSSFSSSEYNATGSSTLTADPTPINPRRARPIIGAPTAG